MQQWHIGSHQVHVQQLVQHPHTSAWLPHPATAPPLPGCDRLESFGELCAHKSDPFAPLAALKQLQSLDYSRCALEQLPPWLGTLPNLTQLLLADNQLTSLPTSWGAVVPAGTAGTPAAAVDPGTAPQPAVGGQRGGAAGPGAAAPRVALPPALRHLELQGNPFAVLPAALLASEASQLTHLDLSRWVWLRLTAASLGMRVRVLLRLLWGSG